MDFNKYQEEAKKTANYPREIGGEGCGLLYPAIGLCGEAGEVAEKVKKAWRNSGAKSAYSLNLEQHAAIVAELGDVLWYVAALATELRVSLEEVATLNIEKLRDRAARGVIKSEGDKR